MNPKTMKCILCIWVIVILAGCGASNPYSFEDPDVIAFIDGAPVHAVQKEQYIMMKKSYYQAIIDASNDLGDNLNNKNISAYDMMLEESFDVKLKQIETVLSYDDSEWDKDYYKTFIVMDQLYKQTGEEELNNFIDEVAEARVNDALHSKDILTYFSNGVSINETQIIENVAKECGLLYEDCADTIYRSFIESDMAYEYLSYYFAKQDYEGITVEWNENNTSEYIEYLFDVYEQYDEYLDQLLSRAEIVER